MKFRMNELNGCTNSSESAASTDAELMRGVIEQDEAAMDVLFNRYHAVVYSVCLRVLKNPCDAEETLLDIFMEVWRRPKRFDVDRGKLATYLMVLARSRAIDHLRSRNSRSRLVAPPGTQPLEQYGDSGQDPAEACSLAERRELARQALAMLSPAQRDAVHYSFFEGLSHREIAERLDLPIGTVKTRIRLGLFRFRDAMARLTGDATRKQHVAAAAFRSRSATVRNARKQTPVAPEHAPEQAPEQPEPVVLSPRARMNTDEKITDREMIRVLLADDNDIFREGLAALLKNQPNIQVVGQARDGKGAVDMAGDVRPDVVVMDVDMPGLDGIQATRQIVGNWGSMRIIGLSVSEHEDVTTAMCEAGAEAFLTKDDPSTDLIATIHRPRNMR